MSIKSIHWFVRFETLALKMSEHNAEGRGNMITTLYPPEIRLVRSLKVLDTFLERSRARKRILKCLSQWDNSKTNLLCNSSTAGTAMFYSAPPRRPTLLEKLSIQTSRSRNGQFGIFHNHATCTSCLVSL